MSLKQVRGNKSALHDSHTDCRQEIETWVNALDCYDHQEFEEAIRLFNEIADTSKILFNLGVIHATLGEHEKAVRPPKS
jgi:hypothetical protein